VEAGFVEFGPLLDFRDWLASIRNDKDRRQVPHALLQIGHRQGRPWAQLKRAPTARSAPRPATCSSFSPWT
jgi:hypothetical protein